MGVVESTLIGDPPGLENESQKPSDPTHPHSSLGNAAAAAAASKPASGTRTRTANLHNPTLTHNTTKNIVSRIPSLSSVSSTKSSFNNTNAVNNTNTIKPTKIKILKGSVLGSFDVGKSSLLRRLRGEEDTKQKSKRRMMALYSWSPIDRSTSTHACASTAGMDSDSVGVDAVQLHIVERHECDYATLKKKSRNGIDFIIIIVDRTKPESLTFALSFVDGMLGLQNDEKDGDKTQGTRILPCVCILLNHYDRLILKEDEDSSTKVRGDSDDNGDADADADDADDAMKSDKSEGKEPDNNIPDDSDQRTSNDSILTLKEVEQIIENKIIKHRPKEEAEAGPEARSKSEFVVNKLKVKCLDACMMNGYGLQALNSFITLPYLLMKERDLMMELARIQNGLESCGNDLEEHDFHSFEELEKIRIDSSKANENSKTIIRRQNEMKLAEEGKSEISTASEKIKETSSLSTVEGSDKLSGASVGKECHSDREQNETMNGSSRRHFMPATDENASNINTKRTSSKESAKKKKKRDKRTKHAPSKAPSPTSSSKSSEQMSVSNLDQNVRFKQDRWSRPRKTKVTHRDPKQALEAFLASDDDGSDNDSNVARTETFKMRSHSYPTVTKRQDYFRNTAVLDSDSEDDIIDRIPSEATISNASRKDTAEMATETQMNGREQNSDNDDEGEGEGKRVYKKSPKVSEECDCVSDRHSSNSINKQVLAAVSDDTQMKSTLATEKEGHSVADDEARFIAPDRSPTEIPTSIQHSESSGDISVNENVYIIEGMTKIEIIEDKPTSPDYSQQSPTINTSEHVVGNGRCTPDSIDRTSNSHENIRPTMDSSRGESFGSEGKEGTGVPDNSISSGDRHCNDYTDSRDKRRPEVAQPDESGDDDCSNSENKDIRATKDQVASKDEEATNSVYLKNESVKELEEVDSSNKLRQESHYVEKKESTEEITARPPPIALSSTNHLQLSDSEDDCFMVTSVNEENKKPSMKLYQKLTSIKKGADVEEVQNVPEASEAVRAAIAAAQLAAENMIQNEPEKNSKKKSSKKSSKKKKKKKQKQHESS